MSTYSKKGGEWDKIARGVKERDGWVCMYQMGGCTYDQDLTVDHIMPVSKGGTDDEWNLITACRTCNGRKTDKMLVRVNWFDRDWFPNGLVR